MRSRYILVWFIFVLIKLKLLLHAMIKLLLRIKSCAISRRALVIYFVLSTWLVSFLWYYMAYYGECSHAESIDRIADICRMYERGETVGDLCPALCTTKELRFTRCINARGHHKYVFLAQYHNAKVIMKIQNFREQDSINPELPWKRESFRELVQAYARAYLTVNIDTPTEIDAFIRTMWYEDLDWDDDPDHLNVTLVTLKSLLHQPEYLFLRHYHDLSFTGTVIGSCGYMYVTQNTPALDSWKLPYKPYIVDTWTTRATIALKFLDLVSAMDSQRPNPLFHCDTRISNYGLSPSGSIVIIDADMIVLKTIHHGANCNAATRCVMIRCWGACKCPNGQCYSDSVSECVLDDHNNLKNICMYIFQSERMLVRAPASIAIALNHTLQECIDMRYDYSTNVGPPVREIQQKLYTLIRRGLQ